MENFSIIIIYINFTKLYPHKGKSFIAKSSLHQQKQFLWHFRCIFSTCGTPIISATESSHKRELKSNWKIDKSVIFPEVMNNYN